MKFRSMAMCNLLSMVLLGACGGSVEEPGLGGSVAVGRESSALTQLGSGFAWVTTSGGLGSGWNSTGGTITTLRLAIGQYEVVFGGQTPTNANAQVTAYGSTNTHCKLDRDSLGVSSLIWYVTCYNPAGALTDSAFNILTDNNTGTGGTPGAYLISSYSGGVSDSWNSAGGTNTVSHTGTGEYTVSMPGMTSYNAAVHVTAVSLGPTRCKVNGWSTGTVYVKCYNHSGALADNGFSLSYRYNTLVNDKIGGHAWVYNGSISSSYTRAAGNCSQNPAPSFSATANGNDLLISLPDSDLATPYTWAHTMPIVTAYGSSTHTCKVVSWSVNSSATTTVNVRCFDNAGNQVNASSTAFDISLTNMSGPFC